MEPRFEEQELGSMEDKLGETPKPTPGAAIAASKSSHLLPSLVAAIVNSKALMFLLYVVRGVRWCPANGFSIKIMID